MSIDNPLTQLDFSIMQANEATPKVKQYVEEHLEEMISEYIVPEIKTIARAMNIPQGFIDGVKYTRTGKTSFKIINTWGTASKPLALWFNYGTKDHGPVKALFLTWISKITGKRIFAKWVRGIRRTNAMEVGIASGKKRFVEAVLLKSREYAKGELDLIE